VTAAMFIYATTELLEEVFSVRSVPRLYNEGQLPLLVSFKPSRGTVLRRQLMSSARELTAEGSIR
jgi:hypothetical protein